MTTGGDDDFRELLDALDPKFRRMRNERFATLRGDIWRASRRHNGRGSARATSARRCTVAVRQPHALARRCVVKGRYVTLTSRGLRTAGLHLAYLERDGVERDGSPGRLYGPESAISAETFGKPLAGERRQFRFIVSPEDGDQLDLTRFARQFMSQVEKDTGRRLIWAAVNHHNTDNPHVHIVIRGVDKDGDDVRIDGRYIGREMRWRAQEIVTRELGPRLESDLARQRSREVTREAFTLIDRMLAGHASESGELAPRRLAAVPPEERAACLARLETLGKMRLAHQEATGTWRLVEGWDATLKQAEASAEARERLARHIPASVGLGRVLEVGQTFDTVEGVVRGIGLHDELGGAMYLAVEAAGAATYYVPVRPEVAEGLRVSDAVRVASPAESWLKPTDRIIARAAGENGGVYDPVAHQRALEVLGGRKEVNKGPSPADLIAANVRRLERLQRYGLAERLPNGRWRVAGDLVATLEARERTHPRRRIQVERLGPDRPITRRRGPEVSR